MTWFKVYSGFSHHPKIVKAGPIAAHLYICGLDSAHTHLTDGRISRATLKHLAHISQPTHYAKILVECGLWEEAEDGDGWIIHDYDLHQSTKADVEKAKVQLKTMGKRTRATPPRNAKNTPIDVDVDVDIDIDKAFAKAPPSRKQDLNFEALAETCGMDWHKLTKNERDKLNTALKQLNEVGATAEEILRRGARYRVMWPTMTLTPTALMNNWSKCAPDDTPVIDCSKMGAGGANSTPDFASEEDRLRYFGFDPDAEAFDFSALEDDLEHS